MMPTVRATILAIGLACATLSALSNGVLAAQASPRAYIPDAALASGPERVSAPPGRAALPALAAGPVVDEAPLPARLALSALSLGGLVLYLRWRARRHA